MRFPNFHHHPTKIRRFFKPNEVEIKQNQVTKNIFMKITDLEVDFQKIEVRFDYFCRPQLTCYGFLYLFRVKK